MAVSAVAEGEARVVGSDGARVNIRVQTMLCTNIRQQLKVVVTKTYRLRQGAGQGGVCCFS